MKELRMNLDKTIVACLNDNSPFALFESTLKTEVELRLGRKVDVAELNRALTHLQFIQIVGVRTDPTTGQTGYFIQGEKVVATWR
jgi:hypothetical protein